MTTARETVPTADEAFGLVVHEAMFRNRISQVKLAATLQCHQTTLGKKLHGERPWSLADMIAVADALRVDLRELLAQMWRDEPTSSFNAGGQQENSAGGWALGGSNSQPTDYKVESSLISLDEFRNNKLRKTA